METTPAFRGLTCTDCGVTVEAAEVTHRCPDCGGILDATYDLDAVKITRETLTEQSPSGIGKYDELLPVSCDTLVTMAEGATPLVTCPRLADELGVGNVFIKDEGRNPTGSVRDRGLAVAVSTAVAHGASDVALPTTGNGGQAAAAYAARAGIDSHSYVPSRAMFVNKAMINVHGGSMSVGEGRYDDSARVFAKECADDWYSLAPFETPYRHEGQKTLAYELMAQLDWHPPDAIVTPTGHGLSLVGLQKGAAELQELGCIDSVPRLYAAQAAGCAPIAEAVEAGRDHHEPWDRPDTICGGIEIPDPTGSHLVLDALRATDGGAVATEDRDILESAVTIARAEGIEMGASASAAASGAWELAEQGAFETDDTVVLLNTATGNKEDDILRNHLMSKGI